MREKTYIIVNEVDRPYIGNVARIQGIQGNNVGYYYLRDGRLGVTTVDRMSYLEDFGVELEFIDEVQIKASIIGESLVKYPDGTVRRWQGWDGQELR